MGGSGRAGEESGRRVEETKGPRYGWGMGSIRQWEDSGQVLVTEARRGPLGW